MSLSLPAPRDAALLLDIDGTLLDFAPTPESVVVPEGLLPALRRLRAALGEALAVVSGRPVDQAEALLEGVPFAVAGEHGAAIRAAPGTAIERVALPALPEAWLAKAEAAAAAHSGVRVERKSRGFVLHYRQAPAAGEALHALAAGLVAEGEERFELLQAAMAWEIRPAGVDKGVAVRRLMASGPFAGRRPIYIGDDVTDEDGIRAAQALGGAGLLVADAFGSPAAVRDWLERSAALDGAGWG